MTDPFDRDPAAVSRWISDRQRLLRHEAEDTFRAEILDYGSRQSKHWRRDYGSEAAYADSVSANRDRWAAAVGVLPRQDRPFAARLDPWFEDEQVSICWLTVDFFGSLQARALLALPKTERTPPLVIAQHGIGSSPEKVFGLDDAGDIYKAYGRRLVEQGFAVLAPMNVSGAHPRARLTRLCSLMGRTLWGVEIARTQRLLDYLETRDDVDMSRVGMYGISLGGAYTMFTTPLEPRITCAAVCAWFNHRPNKMAVDDPRYSCFLSVDEEHVWIPGWLREFTDSDLASLICPRPLFIEHGKADGIAWWPQVEEEFAATAEHYRRLGLEERIGIEMHEGGHEIRMQGTLDFLRRWLQP
ncbi:MAG TPA: dienelactone hydrolase family protein [Candidatus Latescibacteria bacterium]|nr:dienelactone hydrolase family protein [Candidatus Latescibacterota bacterium]